MTDPLSVAVPRDGALTHGLPAPRTRLFGRDAEVEEICRLLDQGAPVTITGPGGIGKTRVAIEVSRRQQRRVVFVQLDDVDRTAVASAIIRACTSGTPGLPAGLPPTATFTLPPNGAAHFAVPAGTAWTGTALTGTALAGTAVGGASPAASSGRWTDQAADLPSRPTVLVLDTFEHVTAAAGLVADLLAALPTLLILVTSRCRLGLRDEQVVPLDGLGVAADGPAAALFRDRARRAGSHRGPPSSVDDAAVLEICDLLGGVPLAIELAAARTALMPPAALLAQLRRTDNRRVLGLLARGAIDLPSRQVSMRATMSWSYQLLDGAQQTLFRRLGVFPGTFDLETAEQVCTGVSADDGWIEPDAVLNGIAALVDLHLVEPAAPIAACNADRPGSRCLMHRGRSRQNCSRCLARQPMSKSACSCGACSSAAAPVTASRRRTRSAGSIASRRNYRRSAGPSPAWPQRTTAPAASRSPSPSASSGRSAVRSPKDSDG
ncbi:ATP-binding protein [Nakamurella sp. GG22]